jgi:hypothetical protein
MKRYKWLWLALGLILLLPVLALVLRATHSTTIRKGPFEISAWLPPEGTPRFGRIVPVSTPGGLALFDDADAFSPSPSNDFVLRLYAFDFLGSSERRVMRWHGSKPTDRLRLCLVTLDGDSLARVPKPKEDQKSTRHEYSLLNLIDAQGKEAQETNRFSYQGQLRYASSPVLRGGRLFGLEWDRGSRLVRLYMAGPDHSSEEVQQVKGVRSLGQGWSGGELSPAVMLDSGEFMLLDDDGQLTEAPGLEKLGLAALNSALNSKHFCLTRDFGVFSGIKGLVAIDKAGTQVALVLRDPEKETPSGRKPGFMREMAVTRKAMRDPNFDTKTAGAAKFMRFQAEVIADEGRHAPPNVYAGGRMALLDDTTVALVDSAYQRVLLIRYFGD